MFFMCHNPCRSHCFIPSIPINNYRPYHHFSNERPSSRISFCVSSVQGQSPFPEISLRHELIDNLFWGLVPGTGNWNRRRQLIPSICIEAGHHCGQQAYFCRNLQKNRVRYTAEPSCEGTEEGASIHQHLCSISQWLPHGTCVNGTFQYSGSPE